jgi:hypothetical protein
MTSMYVPDAVLSLAVRPKNRADDTNFSKSLGRFQKEDPTFRVHFDSGALTHTSETKRPIAAVTIEKLLRNLSFVFTTQESQPILG